jgi:hypothetical protein
MVRALAVAMLLCAAAAAGDATVTLDGAMPADAGFIELPFDVPAGTAELFITHDTLETGAILDWGLLGPDGFRGYGGGNTESITTGVQASSRSYHTGPLTPGTWKLYAGKAKSASGVPGYHVTVTARTQATLAAEGQRAPYRPAAALSKGPRWYAGDLHAHSRESGDAHPTLDAMGMCAVAHGLDFVEISDHNTTSQLELLNDVQARFPQLLFVPGIELTTYSGHANAIGATQWVDHRFGFNGVTATAAAKALAGQGALVSINHPMLDLSTACIGCGWHNGLLDGALSGVEIQTGGWEETGLLFSKQTLAFWDHVLDQGLRVPAVGGSDDHNAGTDATGSPIGSPVTLVYAQELSASALLDGIQKGRTVVKLQGAGDPMIDLKSGDALIGDTVEAGVATVTATVTNGNGAQVRFVVDGKPRDALAVTADPFEATLQVTAPARVRAEVLEDDHPRTVTSHLYVAAPAPKHGCRATGAGPLIGIAIGLAARRRLKRT